MTNYQRDLLSDYTHFMRNISNACLVISEWAQNHGEKSPEDVNWGDVVFANNIYAQLVDLAQECNLTVKTI